jgi:Zn-dependent metalloprotease
MVIEANIEWEKGTSGQNQIITLRKSTPYFSEHENIPVTGASVTVTNDSNGRVFNFKDLNNGDYQCSDFIPKIDQSYSLQIVSEGKTYSSQETLVSIPEITKVEQTEVGGFEGNLTTVKIYFNDPEAVQNYYLADFLASDRPVKTLETQSDQFSDGKEISFEYEGEEDEDVQPGVLINYTVHGISEAYFNYMEILTAQAGGDGGPFQTTPVQLKGNCKNVDDATEEVLGFFRLSEIVKGQYTIE